MRLMLILVLSLLLVGVPRGALSQEAPDGKQQKKEESIRTETWVFGGLALAGIGLALAFGAQAGNSADLASGASSIGSFREGSSDAGYYTGLKNASLLVGLAAAGTAAYYQFLDKPGRYAGSETPPAKPGKMGEEGRSSRRDRDSLAALRRAEEVLKEYSVRAPIADSTIAIPGAVFVGGYLSEEGESSLKAILTLLEDPAYLELMWQVNYRKAEEREKADQIANYLKAFLPRLNTRVAEKSSQLPECFFQLQAFDKKTR